MQENIPRYCKKGEEAMMTDDYIASGGARVYEITFTDGHELQFSPSTHHWFKLKK